MKRKLKQFLSALLVAVMLIGIAPLGGINLSVESTAMDLSSFKVGDVIEFGSYPQSKVTDEQLISELETVGSSYLWVDYNYYAGSGSLSDGKMEPVKGLMLYKDISYNGNVYRAVKINNYRPYITGLESAGGSQSQTDNGYFQDSIYYFKYEPLTWRILDTSEGYVMCDKAIDSQPYQNYLYYYGEEYYNSKLNEKYASNWETSSLRQWLNNSFYEEAFSSSEKMQIGTSFIENKSSYDGYYDCSDTYDKIFPISYEDALNDEYGFDAMYNKYDTKRQLQSTDYAKCQGCYSCSDEKYRGNTCWWVRSAYDSGNSAICSSEGLTNEYESVNCTVVGVVPAFKFNPQVAKCKHNWLAWTVGEDNENYTGKKYRYCAECNELETEDFQVGDVFEFGSYPQSRVVDNDILSNLDGIEKNWQSYGYYSGTGEYDDGNMKSSDYMQYADISYNGNRYRAVNFSQYRPVYTHLTNTIDNSNQETNGYSIGTTYYFKYEPLMWRMLNPAEGYAICTKIIDSQAYQNFMFEKDYVCYNSKDCTNYASDWLTSSLREWLNNDFYGVAFTTEEQAKIGISRLENRKIPSCQFDSKDSYDKIFPISYYDAINIAYGFDSSYFSSTSRVMYGTDYAKCQGLSDGDWWLRLPNYSYSAAWTDSAGWAYFYYMDYGKHTDTTCTGVVPALKLNPSSTTPETTYTVKYDANSGSVSPENSKVTSGDSTILPTPTKDFTITYNANNGVGAPSEQDVSVACKGWSTSSSATSATYACGESFKPIADTTLYAVWNNTVNTMLYSTEPTKEGFVFQGWSTNKNATSATYSAGANISLSSDITLYAIWSKTDNTNPTGSISSTNNVASSQMVTLSLYDNVGVAGYYWGTSSTYTNNTYTSTNSSSVTKTISSSGTYYLTVKDTSGNVSSNYSITFYKTTLNANGGSVSPTSVLTKSGNSFTFPTPTRSGYTYSGWATSNSATSGVSSLTPNSNKTYYAVWYKLENIYNLGDETYSFENFGDDDSYGGHCFGMSITSSGYYTNNLDRKIIGGDTNKSLFSYSKTETVKAPICYYQNIQGSYSRYATVAGGCYYLNGYYDMDSDWKSVVNYVKNHSYDNKGSLQVGYRKNSQGGHAINFLYYKEVNGEQRIYVYDNNFPNTETYLYKSEDGRVYQAPYSTFSGSIDCIALRDVSKYYDIAGDFDASRCIYAETGAIDIKGDVLKTPMEGLINGIEYTMYELQDNVDMVTVIPLKDNATFSYLNVDYSFDVVKDDTYGLLELLDSEHGALGEKAKFTIIDENFKKVKSVSVSDVSLNYKASTTIKSNITADEGAEYTVTYTSSNPSVARVDENGKVYGAKRGSTEITVTVTDEYGNTASDTCKVNVTYAWWQWIIVIVLFGWIWY